MKTLLFIVCSAFFIYSCDGACQQVFDNRVTPQDINTIVNKHNDLRKLIANAQVPKQPRGINLKRLKWDRKLASEAQRIANTCEFKHVKVSDGRWRFGVGQNLYISKSSSNQPGANWNEAIQSWFDEVKQYKYPGGFSMKTGHYTQVVWADTEFIGCGYTHYKGGDPRFSYEKLYVCNYGPAGNVNNQPPYKTGSRRGCENLC